MIKKEGKPNKIAKVIFEIAKYGEAFIYKYKLKKYSQIVNEKKLIKYNLPKKISIQLKPEGQIAEYIYTRNFEYAELSVVIEFLKPGMNVIDIGANIGLYSIVADKIIGNNGNVWAFEPASDTYQRLLENLTLNNSNSVKPAKMAIANVDNGVMGLQRDPGYQDGERYLLPRKNAPDRASNLNNDNGDYELVNVTTLDKIYQEIGSQIQIDFMKIDVEGGEYEVLKGAQEVLHKNKNIVIFFECTLEGCQLAGHNFEEVINFLQKFQFKIYSFNKENKFFDDNIDNLKIAGNLWACRDKTLLPYKTDSGVI